MAVQTTGNELVTSKNIRAFFQPGGAGPDNRKLFAGQDMSYIRISGVDNPLADGIDGYFVPEPTRSGDYRSVATLIKPPSLPKANLILNDKHNAIPRQYIGNNCIFNLYEVIGNCRDLSDFNNGWTDGVLIYPAGRITTRGYGDRTAMEDKAVESTLGVVFGRKIYPVGSLVFGSPAATLTSTPITDVIFAGGTQCADCGVDNDGTKWLYAVATGGAAAKPIIWYSTDGGKTVTSASIAAAANAEAIAAIGVMGSRLVAVSKVGGTTVSAIYWADLNILTGAPGTFTKVTTGFVASGQVNDMLILTSTEAWFAADGGYIYYTNDVSGGVQVSSAGGTVTSNLNRIDGNADVLVVCGAAGAIIRSTNRGGSWASLTTSPSGNSLQALSVVSSFTYFVGDASGGFFYTKNAGETWTTRVLGTFTAVSDILMVTPEVGYLSALITGPTAQLWFTIDGGNTWTRTGSRIAGNYPTHNAATRLAAPMGADPGLAANVIAIGGLSAVSADGKIYVGSAGIF
jgi:hypothetical protein